MTVRFPFGLRLKEVDLIVVSGVLTAATAVIVLTVRWLAGGLGVYGNSVGLGGLLMVFCGRRLKAKVGILHKREAIVSKGGPRQLTASW